MRSGSMLLLSRRTGYRTEQIQDEYKLNRTTFSSRTLHGWIYNHLWRAVERVRVEDGLYHYEWLCQILTHKMMPVVGRLVRTVIEHLQEWGSPQVEHELSRENQYLLISEMWYSPTISPYMQIKHFLRPSHLYDLKTNNVFNLIKVKLHWIFKFSIMFYRTFHYKIHQDVYKLSLSQFISSKQSLGIN